MQRLITAAILAPVLWVMIKMAPPIAFAGMAVVLIGVAGWECYRMLENRGARPFTWLGIAAGMAVVWSFSGSAYAPATHLPIVILTVLSVILAMWRRSDPGAMLDATMNTVFPVLLVQLGLAYLVGLRMMPGEDGPDLLLLLFICVIFADAGAFYVGTTLGKTRMAPRLSPKKSWEGFAGGLVASVGAALLAHFWFYQRLPWGHAVALGLILGVAAVLGDLAESVIKRAAGVKDSSSLIPGHGGLMDRTDSLLFAGPILFYYYRLFLQAGV